MEQPKRQYTEDAKKALKILGDFIDKHPTATKTIQVYRFLHDYRYLPEEKISIAEKYIKATIRQEEANK